jgi:hypothetical protein
MTYDKTAKETKRDLYSFSINPYKSTVSSDAFRAHIPITKELV